MQRAYLYLLLCIFGTLLPLGQFVPWLTENGLDLRLFVDQLFANRISAFFGMDVLVSALVVAIFARVEGDRLNSTALRIWPLVALCCVGVSLALPLLLYLRERREGQ